ncbi:hypothetical protein ElyMa_000193700 [Elysia marginata]|uniref:Uncharacterized protein n=1 Tax=Elysia marginata TaxID=1093978 RepID=A0AAV4EWS8_9GAST|nr:hypothetical protein ElyMa_000193700 [Elysia marginata]
MSESTRVLNTVSGLDMLSSTTKETLPPISTSFTQTSKPFCPNGDVNHSEPAPHSPPYNMGQGKGLGHGMGGNSPLQSPVSSPWKSPITSSNQNAQNVNNHVSQKINGSCKPNPDLHSRVIEVDLQSPKPKTSALKPVKIRPTESPAIRYGNGFTETIFQIPSPVPSKTLSWGSDEHLTGGRGDNSDISSPAKVSVLSSAMLPLENDEQSRSTCSSKASLTNCLPLRLTSKPSPSSIDRPATPLKDRQITGILKTPTKSTTIFTSDLNPSPALKAGVGTGPNFKNTDFSSTQSLKVFATTLSGEEMFNETRRFSDRDIDRPNGDKTSSVLLNSINKLHSAPQDVPESRGVTFQADQMSHVFSRFKALFDGSEPPPPHKTDTPEKEDITKTHPSHEARSIVVL